MNRPRLVLFLLFAAVASGALGFSSHSRGQSMQREIAAVPSGQSYVPGEVLVRFRPDMNLRAQASIMAALGDRAAQATVGSDGFALITLQSGRTMVDALAAYGAMPGVERVQPNYIYRFLALPNDPNFDQLWGLRNVGQTVNGIAGVAGADMDLEPAWERVTDCSQITVAVLDSGVNYTHQDLAANMWDGSAAGFTKHGFDVADNDDDPMPSDTVGHGTHVAGIIGAVGNNGVGTTGVCWKASLMAVRVGGIGGATTASLVQGMQFAVTHGAKIINMSLGGPARDPALEGEIVNARENDVLIVAAAGNSGTDNDSGVAPLFPCNFPQDNVICVAALDQNYSRVGFSNFGATSVDVGAPGTVILSTWPGVTIADNFSGWTRTGGWAELACDFNVGPLATLANPATWCSSAPGQYANNATEVAYKNFNLSSALHARANFTRFVETEADQDFLGFAKRADGGDPFGAGGVLIKEVSGPNNGAVAENVDLSGCLTSACTFGFRLRSSPDNADNGVGIVRFQIDTAQSNSNAYQFLDGTSMSTPHTAGVAALVWAHNPAYTYLDVANAVKLGGESLASLAGITSTGRAVNAASSLRYVNPPSGVSATLLP